MIMKDKIELADIQELNESIISHNVTFYNGLDELPGREWLEFRKQNRSNTQIFWITKRLVMNAQYFIYNSRARITIILN